MIFAFPVERKQSANSGINAIIDSINGSHPVVKMYDNGKMMPMDEGCQRAKKS